MVSDSLSAALNSSDSAARESALVELSRFISTGKLTRVPNNEVNNHVHTIYSFSPYSPSGAAFASWKAGLKAAGIIDHDTIAGAGEFIQACSLCKIASTSGFETRVNFFNTPFHTSRLNNPDSTGIAYITIQGIPARHFSTVTEFLKPVQQEREKRSKKEVEALNAVLAGIPGSTIGKIDFDNDVYAFSQADRGGTITERHILAALARKIMKAYGTGSGVVDFLEHKMHVSLQNKSREYLLQTVNPHYLYDLLGILKSVLLPSFFIQPKETECLPVETVVRFALSIDAIPSYSYLGDVKMSKTGDKIPQTFEDSYLDNLFPVLKDIGFRAVTFMPPRNTVKQLQRVMKLCRKFDFMQISGVDINSSRQSFNCPEIETPLFSHLNTSTWALIAHEKLTNYDEHLSLFGNAKILKGLPLDERIQLFGRLGKMLDSTAPFVNSSVKKELYE